LIIFNSFLSSESNFGMYSALAALDDYFKIPISYHPLLKVV